MKEGERGILTHGIHDRPKEYGEHCTDRQLCSQLRYKVRPNGVVSFRSFSVHDDLLSGESGQGLGHRTHRRIDGRNLQEPASVLNRTLGSSQSPINAPEHQRGIDVCCDPDHVRGFVAKHLPEASQVQQLHLGPPVATSLWDCSSTAFPLLCFR